jgi:dihydrofolate reductase
MRKLLLSAFVSLDGVMQAPGGPEEDPTGGFEHGGWVATMWDDTLGAAMSELFAEPFDLVLGRRTYDIFAAHWPHIEIDPTKSDFDQLTHDIAKKFNAITKYVATHHPESLTWQNSEALGADVTGRMRALKAGDGANLLIQGSSELIQQLLAADLVDEIRTLTFPILLGRGKRLFREGVAPGALRLTHSAVSTTGVVVARYERAGAVATGSFAMETPTAAELERREKLKREAR